MSTFFRRDDWVTDALGNAIAGASVYVCSQPATTTSIPPSPLVQLYSDPNGAFPITQPVLTDGLGHSFYYVAQGTYTIVYASPRIQQVTLLDQIISSPVPPTTSWNSDSSTAGTITGAINGTNTNFMLSGSPTPESSLIFTVNGLVQAGVMFASSNQIVLTVAPHAGNILAAVYQVTT
jgi:hypothetical protein